MELQIPGLCSNHQGKHREQLLEAAEQRWGHWVKLSYDTACRFQRVQLLNTPAFATPGALTEGQHAVRALTGPKWLQAWLFPPETQVSVRPHIRHDIFCLHKTNEIRLLNAGNQQLVVSVWLFIFSVRISSNRKSLEVGFPIDQVSKLNIILAASFPLRCTSYLTSSIELVSLFILQCKYILFLASACKLNNIKEMSELKEGWQRRSRTVHEGCIQCGNLLTSYSVRYIICHMQSGLTHSYCFILTLFIFYLLLPRFLNYFKLILENPVIYDIFLLFFSWYAEKNYTKFRRQWFLSYLLFVFCQELYSIQLAFLPNFSTLSKLPTTSSHSWGFLVKISTLLYHNFTGFDYWSQPKSISKNIP